MGILFQSGQSYTSRSRRNRSLLRLGSGFLACAAFFLLTSDPVQANAAESQQTITPLPPFVQLDQQFSNFRLPRVGIEAISESEANFVKQDQLRTPNRIANDPVNPESGASPTLNLDSALSADRIGPQRPKEATSLSIQPRPLQWKEVRKWEIAFQILNAADAIETISCIDRHNCYEMNPMLGPHPTASRVILLKAGTGLLHYAVTRYIFKKKPEWVDEWMITTTIAQGGIVLWNLQHCF